MEQVGTMREKAIEVADFMIKNKLSIPDMLIILAILANTKKQTKGEKANAVRLQS